jgi:hypothetical protein
VNTVSTPCLPDCRFEEILHDGAVNSGPAKALSDLTDTTITSSGSVFAPTIYRDRRISEPNVDENKQQFEIIDVYLLAKLARRVSCVSCVCKMRVNNARLRRPRNGVMNIEWTCDKCADDGHPRGGANFY